MPYKDPEKEKAYRKEWRLKHPFYDRERIRDPEKLREYHKNHYRKNKKRILETHKKYYRENKEKYLEQKHRYYQENKKSILQRMKIYGKEKQAKLRRQILIHYGGNPPKCACCKEAHIEFLAIDHINGDGAKQRKEFGRRGVVLYRYLVKNNYPKGYRVLCHNCNMSFGFYGYCPHQKR